MFPVEQRQKKRQPASFGRFAARQGRAVSRDINA